MSLEGRRRQPICTMSTMLSCAVLPIITQLSFRVVTVCLASSGYHDIRKRSEKIVYLNCGEQGRQSQPIALTQPTLIKLYFGG